MSLQPCMAAGGSSFRSPLPPGEGGGEPREPPGEGRPGFALYTIGLALAVAGAVLAVARMPVGPDPLPPFALTDQDGHTVTLADLRGSVWVADFIFTRCGGPCPVMTADMAALRADLPDEVRLVSFTVDPTYDTPDVLRRYAEGRPWTFLTGRRDAIYDLSIHGFRVAAAAQENQIIHSSYFFLVDRRGRVAGRFALRDEPTSEVDAVERARLLGEARDLVGFVSGLPRLNATLNGASAVLLVLGFVLVRALWLRAHAAAMSLALVVSALFLASYLYYHHEVGSRPFQGPAWVRPIYLGILVSHAVLAAVMVPLILTTFARALRRSFERHRAIARITLPVWLYVSVTGVLVYFMLYVWFAPT